jgi:hypothetical protein
VFSITHFQSIKDYKRFKNKIHLSSYKRYIKKYTRGGSCLIKNTLGRTVSALKLLTVCSLCVSIYLRSIIQVIEGLSLDKIWIWTHCQLYNYIIHRRVILHELSYFCGSCYTETSVPWLCPGTAFAYLLSQEAIQIRSPGSRRMSVPSTNVT